MPQPRRAPLRQELQRLFQRASGGAEIAAPIGALRLAKGAMNIVALGTGRRGETDEKSSNGERKALHAVHPIIKS